MRATTDGGTEASDSDADPATGITAVITLDDANTALTGTYDRDVAASQGIDPTWDAGVVLQRVSLGDLVWVDANRDGLQDEGEPGIPGVVLVLTGPDGQPVTDVFGEVVAPVTTDDNGAYLFENLPVLGEGEQYTVRIDRDASAKALAPYVPTVMLEEGRGDRDSSTWTASTVAPLNRDGDHDPTLDFGFVTPEEVGGGDSTPPATGIPATGGTLPWATGIGALVLMALGLGLVLRRRTA